MKALLLILSLGLTVATTGFADTPNTTKATHKKSVKTAKSGKVAKAKKKANPAQGNLQTDVSFDDSVLHGEYQAPEEALVKVENEKGFGDLLGVRKHFKDRLSVAAEQE